MSQPLSQTNRRRLLIGAAALAPGALAAPYVRAQTVRRLTMATTWPRSLPGLADSVERFTNRVNAMGAGLIELETFAAGERVGPFDVFDAVSQGDLDLYHGADYYWQAQERALNFFTAVPFGFTADEITGWMHVGGGQALWDEVKARFNLKSFLSGNTGVQMGGWYDRPITSLEDMRGLKIRIPGLAADIFQALGSEPVLLPAGAIAEALFEGEINAVEWVGPYNDLEFGVQKILNTYMYPGFHEPGTATNVSINLRVWERLDDQARAIIAAAAHAENKYMLAEYSARSGRALEQMKLEYGTQVLRFPDEVYARVAEIVADTMTGIAEDGDFSGRVVDSFFAYRAQVAPWSRRTTGRFGLRRDAYQKAALAAAQE
ncbi:MAG: TRAP transporter substrate-binding protein [Pseudomonadota bacterium]